MDLSHRVAFRYMTQHRQAGVFEAPPAMLEEIGDWFTKIYAGHVLARVEKQLDELRATESSVDRQIKEMEGALASVERDIKRLPSGKTIKYPMYARRYGRVKYIGVRRKKDTWYDPKRPRAQVYVHPPLKPEPDYEPVYEVGETPRSGGKQLNFLINYGAPGQTGTAEEVADYVRKRIERKLSFFEGVTPGGEQEPAKLDAQIVELLLLERECKKYTPTAKAYRARAQRSFPVDLRGWKYLRDIKRHYEEGEPPIKATDRIIATALKVKGWQEIKVVLNFKPYEKSVGTWWQFKRELRVDVRTIGSLSTMGFAHRYWVKKFREAVAETLRTLRHELQHMGQDVFTELMGLKSEAGTPAAELTEVKPPARGRKPHALREEEFYTRLADEIERFVRHVRKHGEARKSFDTWITDTDFFRALRRKEPAKWRKAVKEFAKGVEAAGINVPGKEHEEKMDSALQEEVSRYEAAEPWKTQRDAIKKWFQSSPYFKRLPPHEREEKQERFKELLRARN